MKIVSKNVSKMTKRFKKSTSSIKMTTPTLNIAHLIEKNSMTRLSKNYENKFLMRIKENFNENQQQLFVASFYCYLNYDKKKDFVVNFDNVWKWLGFARKDPAKRVLEKHFTLDTDYQVNKPAPQVCGAGFDDELLLHQSVEQKNNDERDLFAPATSGAKNDDGRGGSNKETIMLSVNTFKKFCLKAGTKKADEVHDYYIKLEELLQDTVEEESNELRKQLTTTEEEKNKFEESYKKTADKVEQLQVMLHKKRETRIISNEKFVIYFLVAHINGRTTYIIGRAADVNKRYRSYKLKGILIHEEDIKLAYYRSCRCGQILNQVESNVILKMSKYLIPGHREIFESDEFSETEMVDKFKTVIDFYVNSFEDVSPNIVIQDKELREETRVRTEIYLDENREEINEMLREDRKEDPEKYRERDRNRDPEKKKAKDKRYREKHREAIREKDREKYQNNKVEIQEKRREQATELKEVDPEIAEKMAEKKLKYLQEYREQNLAKIKKQRTSKIQCLGCKVVLTRQCWKKHTASLSHINAIKQNPEILNQENQFEVVPEVNDVISQGTAPF